MPFAGFDSFETCSLKMKEQGHSEESANKICGSLQAKSEGKQHTAQFTDIEQATFNKYSKEEEVKVYESLDNCEIFAVGTWNRDKYNSSDLEMMVQNFETLKDVVKPPAKIGHSETQDLLKKEGLPAAGWVDTLKMVGNKVVASFKDVPKVVKDLIDKRAYKRVSAEIYPTYKDPSTGKVYKNVLRAVAFLGADIPSVETLSDVAALYSDTNVQEYKMYTFDVAKFNAMDTKVRFISNKINIKIREIE